MARCLSVMLLVALLGACASKEQPPVLKGILWGGEGNRLTITSVSDTGRVIDTLLIDNTGEFTWMPDTLVAGFYRIEDMYRNGITLLLEPDKTLVLDGVYSSFPQFVDTHNTTLPETLNYIKRNTEEWGLCIKMMAAQIDSASTDVTRPLINRLYRDFDSVQNIFQVKALAITGEPLSRMFALMQSAGNNSLFDPWKQRELFFAADSLLKPYSHLREVMLFSSMVERLKEMQKKYDRVAVGSRFPRLIFTESGDTLDVKNSEGTPVYVEIRQPGTLHTALKLLQYQQQFTVYIVVSGSEGKNNLPAECTNFRTVFTGKDENTDLVNRLGIMQYPANFIINNAGTVVAKNIWGDELKQLLDTMLKTGN